MKTVFTQIISLSISASLIACLVMLLRLVLKKSPRFIVCALWALVAVRLLIPALPESKVSLMPRQVSSGSLVEEIAARPVESTLRVKKSEPRYVKIIEKNPQIPVRYQGDEAYVEVSEKTLEAPKTVSSGIMPFLAWIWLGGAVLMLAYMGFSYFRIWRKVGACLKRGEGIYICDNISSPFILGIIRPKIYLPSSLKEENKAYVIAHEEAHLKRLDHLWKPLGYFLLSLHWFNPLLWAAYILLCRDIEMACDEKVTGREGREYRQAYSEALLACSMPARLVTACPLAFGEVGVKTRVKSVLHYKKPAFWLLLLTLLACAVAAGCALTNPSQPVTTPEGSLPATETARETTPAATTEGVAPAATDPATQAPATDPATQTPAADPAAQPASESGDTQPWIGKVIEQALSADQQGVMAAELAMRWTPAVGTDGLFTTGRGITDFYTPSLGSTYLLSEGLLIPGNYDAAQDNCWVLPDIDVHRFVVNTERVPSSDLMNRVFYVLKGEALMRIVWQDPQSDPDMENAKIIPLPDGLQAADVMDLQIHTEYHDNVASSSTPMLLTYSGTAYLLDSSFNWRKTTQYGYGLFWPDDHTLEIRTREVCWRIAMPRQQVFVLNQPTEEELVLCTTGENSGVYVFREGSCLASSIDMSDWADVPTRFARYANGYVYVLAPRHESVELYRLEPGVTCVKAAKTLTDLSDKRADILGGEVLALYEGKTLDEGFGGFVMDLDGDGRKDEITLDEGVGNHNALCREWYINSFSAGTGRMRYHWEDYGLEGLEVIWPEEATFSYETPYKAYLASLDGVRITLFMESDTELYGLDFHESYAVGGGVYHIGRCRIRGFGKSMKDFMPNRPLEEYIAQGWQLAPSEGDQLDVTGDGQDNRIHWQVDIINSPENPIMLEHLAVDAAGKGLVSYDGEDSIVANEKGRIVRYGSLYYLANENGGYDLKGELALNGRTLLCRYQLVHPGDQRVLEKGEDFSSAIYGPTGYRAAPLPGWEGVSQAYKTYFENLEGNNAVSAGELAQLRQLFGDLFVGHFLLEEYDNAGEINPEILFYDGIPQDAWTGSAIEPSEEEKTVVLSVLPEGFTTSLYRAEAQTVFDRYTDYELNDVQQEIRFTYVEQLDAWYWSKGDTENRYYSIIDAYVNQDGTVTALWRSLWSKPGQDDKYGLVTLRRSEEGWKILSNRFLKEEDLADLVDRGILRAWGEKVLNYDQEGSGGGKTEINWYGKPIRPVDYDYQVETGYMILDQAGKRLIVIDSQGKTVSLSLDFCSHPVQIAYVFGGDGREERLFVLAGTEVLSARVKRDAAYEPIALELDQRIPLPEGLHASEVREIRSWTMPGGSDRALLLMSQDQGNYVLAPGSTAFTPTEEGWHMVREGSHVTIWQENARWELEIPEEDVRVLDIQTYGGREQYSLSLFVREKDGLSAEIRQYDARGQRGVSSLDLSDWTYTDCRMQGSGEKNYVMAPKKTGLYMYYVKPGLHNLQLVPDGLDYSFQQTEMLVLVGDVVAVPELSASVTDPNRGLFLDFDQDGTQDALSIERSLDPEGRLGIEFYYKGRSAGASRTLGAAGMLRETEEPCFFTPEEEYRFYLASLDGRRISLIMSNEARTLAVEFVKLESNYGGVKGGYMARVRMRGEGKTMEDFKPCQGIHQYLEEGWEVRPSEGDKILMAPGGEEMTIHMQYMIHAHHSEGSYYTESIRVENHPGTLLGVSEGEYDLIYHRFDHLSYVINDLGNLTILQGWMEDGSRKTIYRIDKVNDEIIFR